MATTEVTIDPVTHAWSMPITQDGYGLLGAGVIWKTGGPWTVSLQGSNLARRGVPDHRLRDSLDWRAHRFLRQPAAVHLSARYEF